MKHIKFILSSLLMLLFVCCNCAKKVESPLTSYDGVEINFIEKGAGDISLLLIPGWTNDLSIWNEQIEYFSENYRVVAVDLPGFGKSGSNRQDWSIPAYAKDIKTIITTLQLEKVVVVGFSMGGPVAVEAAKGDKNNIAGVLLVDTMQNIEMTFAPQLIAQQESVFMDLIMNPTKEKLVEYGFFKYNIEESTEKVLAMLKDHSTVGWRESFNGMFKWHNESCIDALKNVSVPIISINSDIQPTNVVAFNKYLKSYQLKTITDTGHVIMWDQTEEFNRLLEESIEGMFK